MKTYIIAEVGQAHDGSLGILHSYIDAVATTGADAIKFQTHIAEAESSEFEPFRVAFSYEDATRYDYWKRMSFTEQQWFGIKKHCDDVGLEFMSSPFSLAAVSLLEKIGTEKYKLGSGEITNNLMLDAICETGKPIILSSGMSSYDELDFAVGKVKKSGNELSILQCTTQYPTGPKDIGLNVINQMKERYQVSTGLSDHSGTIFPSLAAVSLGASVIEAHIVFDKNIFGPDSKSSLTVSEFKSMVTGIRSIKTMLNNPIEKGSRDFSELKGIFEKSLAINKPVKAGHIISKNDLESKKPKGKGVSAQDYHLIIGKKVNRELNQWDFINLDDIDE